MTRAAAILLCFVLGCGGRSRLPLPPPPATLVATPEDAFTSPPDPAPTTAPPTIPSIVERRLANGIAFYFVQRSDVPSTSVVFVCRASGTEDRGVTHGIDELVERVLERVGHNTSVRLGGNARPDVSMSASGITISRTTSATSLSSTVQIIASMVRSPTIDDAMVIELRHALYEEIAPSARGPSWMRGIHEREMIYGPHDPRAQPWYGDPAVFGRLSMSDVLARHAQLFTPSESAIVVVGDADLDRTYELVQHWFEDWQAPAILGTRLPPAAFPQPSARLHAIPSAGDETMIEVREHAPTRENADRPAFEVLTALLGGMFGARMNHVVREERGHTYGIQAQIVDRDNYAMLEIDLAIPAAHIRDTVFTIIDELRRTQDASQIETTELAAARATAIAAYRRRFATRAATASTLASLFAHHTEMAVLVERATAAEHVTAEDVARAARTWLRPDATPILAVGSYQRLRGAIYLIPGGSEFVVWRW
jgi:predicted Zn-dependent peptidase